MLKPGFSIWLPGILCRPFLSIFFKENFQFNCIPQERLARIERGRKRQGLVPDAKVPGERGSPATLCELKFISASKSRYPRNPRPRNGVRGVDRRAAGLTESYASKARNVDWSYCGTTRPPGDLRRGLPAVREIGPVEAKLRSFGPVSGWVFGAWGEASHTLPHDCWREPYGEPIEGFIPLGPL